MRDKGEIRLFALFVGCVAVSCVWASPWPDRMGALPGDIIYDGQEPCAQLGTSVGCAGDLDGDGTSDVITGAPYYTPPSAKCDPCDECGRVNGCAYVLFGEQGLCGEL